VLLPHGVVVADLGELLEMGIHAFAVVAEDDQRVAVVAARPLEPVAKMASDRHRQSQCRAVVVDRPSLAVVVGVDRRLPPLVRRQGAVDRRDGLRHLLPPETVDEERDMPKSTRFSMAAG
jgi:hypothetical protein